jgi:hypothetical protein
MSQLQVEIVRMGHALVDGDRGEAGGAPSKDSVWGFGFVTLEEDGQQVKHLVKFYGRRERKLRFKREAMSELQATHDLYQLKLKGADVKGIQYVDVSSERGIKETWPNIVADVSAGYQLAISEGKVNLRSFAS